MHRSEVDSQNAERHNLQHSTYYYWHHTLAILVSCSTPLLDPLQKPPMLSWKSFPSSSPPRSSANHSHPPKTPRSFQFQSHDTHHWSDTASNSPSPQNTGSGMSAYHILRDWLMSRRWGTWSCHRWTVPTRQARALCLAKRRGFYSSQPHCCYSRRGRATAYFISKISTNEEKRDLQGVRSFQLQRVPCNSRRL